MMPLIHRFIHHSPWLLPGFVAAALYFQVWDHIYIEFDDMYYTYECPMVVRGLSWEGVSWAFSGSHVANYHPLTWLSHMLDFQLFGNQPGLFALENGALHAANATLLAVLFSMLFRSRSLGIAAALVFAAHPKLVEAVAWISQRKTLLSTFFALGAMILYLRSLQNSGEVRHARAYAGSLVLFALSLLAKSMYVTMPAILLLLEWIGAEQDHRRKDFQATCAHARKLAARLAPFGVLAILCSVVTFWAQAGDHAVHSVDQLSLGMRAATAFIGVTTYLGHFVYPVGLSIFYPLPEAWGTAAVLGAIGLVLLISTALIMLRRFAGATPLLGWLLFLGMLAPVIGIVQVGAQASADRYMYGPIIGLLVASVALFEATRRLLDTAQSTRLLHAAFGLWLAFCAAATFRQVSYWTTSYSLALASEESIGPHPQLLSIRATLLMRMRRYDEAIPLCRRALELEPTHLASLQNLAVAEFETGHTEEAIRLCILRIQVGPDSSGAYTNLALFFARSGQKEQAREAIAAARSKKLVSVTELKALEAIEAELDAAPQL